MANRVTPGREGYKILFNDNTVIINHKFAAAAAKYGTKENRIIRNIRHDFPGMTEVIVSGRECDKAKSNSRLTYDLTDILINRNEFGGFQITGTGTHNGVPTFVGVAPRKSSSRKYACPCCGMSVRATKVVNIACMDCDEQLLLVG